MGEMHLFHIRYFWTDQARGYSGANWVYVVAPDLEAAFDKVRAESEKFVGFDEFTQLDFDGEGLLI